MWSNSSEAHLEDDVVWNNKTRREEFFVPICFAKLCDCLLYILAPHLVSVTAPTIVVAVINFSLNILHKKINWTRVLLDQRWKALRGPIWTLTYTQCMFSLFIFMYQCHTAVCNTFVSPQLLAYWVGFLFFLQTFPSCGSYDALVLLRNVLHMAAGRGSKLGVEWCFCSTWIIPESSKRVLSGTGLSRCPRRAHASAPHWAAAACPSTNNLLWEEVSVLPLRVYFLQRILTGRWKDITKTAR